jgi:predicted nucleic acid-binding protein
MVLVDTSAWIHFLRPKGDDAVRAKVAAALVAGSACWCGMVRLELWNGAGERERRVLRAFERDLPDLAFTPEVWSAAYALARRCRDVGHTVPATDLLVEACARHYRASLIHADADFDRLDGVED